MYIHCRGIDIYTLFKYIKTLFRDIKTLLKDINTLFRDIWTLLKDIKTLFRDVGISFRVVETFPKKEHIFMRNICPFFFIHPKKPVFSYKNRFLRIFIIPKIIINRNLSVKNPIVSLFLVNNI